VIRITTFLLGTVNFNRLGGKLVYGGEGDLIAEPTKGSRQHLGALFLFSGTQELGVLRGVMKREKLWHSFSDEIKPLPVHTQIGRAMTLDEKTRLAKAAGMHPKWQNARWAMVLALNTTMRASEIKALRWRDVDFLASTITIRKSETEAGQRVIPLNDDALSIMRELYSRASAISGTHPAHYAFPRVRMGTSIPRRFVEPLSHLPVDSKRRSTLDVAQTGLAVIRPWERDDSQRFFIRLRRYKWPRHFW